MKGKNSEESKKEINVSKGYGKGERGKRWIK
jgi:hypothetical protein